MISQLKVMVRWSEQVTEVSPHPSRAGLYMEMEPRIDQANGEEKVFDLSCEVDADADCKWFGKVSSGTGRALKAEGASSEGG